MSYPPRLVAFPVVILLALGLCACSSTPPQADNPAPTRTGSSSAGDDLALTQDGGAMAMPASQSGSAAGEERSTPTGNYPNMYRRFGLNAGAALYGNFDTTIQVDTDYVVGANLDLEDFLGLDEDNFIARVDAYYSFSPRHRVDLSVYDINRDGTKTVGEDIQVGQVVIPAGDVDTSLDTLIIKAAYRYNFVADTRTAIGASFGLHTMGIDFGVKSPEFEVSESFNVTAPLPVFGLHGEYALSERWKLLASAEMFQIDLGFAQGFLSDTRIALEHDLFEHFGWGLALNGFQLNAEFEDSPLTADLEYAYQGLLLYLRGYL